MVERTTGSNIIFAASADTIVMYIIAGWRCIVDAGVDRGSFNGISINLHAMRERERELEQWWEKVLLVCVRV